MTADEPTSDEPTPAEPTSAEPDPDEPASDHENSNGTESDTATTESMSSNSQTDIVDAARLHQLFDYALVIAFVVAALVAALSFYSQVGLAIEIWVADAYEPIAKAAVNLALLFIAVAGVSYQLTRIASRRSDGDGDEE